MRRRSAGSRAFSKPPLSSGTTYIIAKKEFNCVTIASKPYVSTAAGALGWAGAVLAA